MTYPDKFLKITKFTLFREGPMSNDKYDPGGLTRFGISKAAYPNLDISALTQSDALDIYYNDYYLKVKADILVYAFSLAMFECAVNQGVSAAVKCFQIATGLTEDGVLGPVTLAALNANRANSEIYASFMSARISKYVAIESVNKNNYDTNHNGWFRRLTLCIMAGAEG